jgi:hypothetical protein
VPNLMTSDDERPRCSLCSVALPQRDYFVSEASVYRLLKAHDLITSPAFITMKAADEFKKVSTSPSPCIISSSTWNQS